MTARSSSPAAWALVTCGDDGAARWSPWTAGLGGPVHAVGTVPTRAEIDPLLDDAAGLVVAGDDAAAAAVLVRLLRRERLDLPLALLLPPASPAAAAWGLPTDPPAAVALARDGIARPVPLVRDDRGGVVLGRHEVGAFHGSVYCDEHLVAHGDAAGLVVRPDEAAGVAASVTGPRRLAGLRAGHVSTRTGRAVQIGCHPATVVRDGVPDDRPIQRRSWYRHLTDWHLVAPVR